MSRKIATRIRPAIAARHASVSESLPSVAEMSVRSSVSNLTGKAPVWSTSAMSFASRSESRPWICARPPPMPLREARVGEVDLREGLYLAVEDDREVLRLLAQLSANPLVASDALEGVGAGIRELHRHDGAPARARAGVEVRSRPRELQVLTRHLRDVRAGRT